MTDTSSATPPSFSIRAAGDRNIMTAVVAALPAPSAAFFDEARAADLTKEEHDRLAGQLPALSAIEVVRSRAADDAPAGNNTTVAAWNAERLKYHAPSVELVRRSGADVLLLSEADLGMAGVDLPATGRGQFDSADLTRRRCGIRHRALLEMCAYARTLSRACAHIQVR